MEYRTSQVPPKYCIPCLGIKPFRGIVLENTLESNNIFAFASAETVVFVSFGYVTINQFFFSEETDGVLIYIRFVHFITILHLKTLPDECRHFFPAIFAPQHYQNQNYLVEFFFCNHLLKLEQLFSFTLLCITSE